MTTRPHLWLRQGLCLITLPSSARSTIWRALILLGLAGLYAPVFSDIARTWWTQRYVFILSNQVVEHLYDPVAICSTLAKLLRLGGILYVDVPNADQFRERIHRGKFLSPTDHLNHFTKKTLA